VVQSRIDNALATKTPRLEGYKCLFLAQPRVLASLGHERLDNLSTR